MKYRILYRFIGWFLLVNVGLSLLIAMSYSNVLPDFQAMRGAAHSNVVLGWIFLITAFVTQMALCFFISGFFVLIVVTLMPRLSIAFFLSVLVSVVLLFVFMADRILYAMYHMHYLAVGLEVFKSGTFSQVIPLSKHEWTFVIGIFVILFMMESAIAWLVWRRVRQQNKGWLGYGFVAFFAAFFCIAYGFNFLAMRPQGLLSVTSSHDVLAAARLVPYYNEIYAFLVRGATDVRHLETQDGVVDVQIRPSANRLQYPLHALQCRPQTHPLNIVVIGIDTWRYDAMNAQASPNIYRFSKKTQQFQNEWSGGNCTEPGLFSLFYGIPANYWHAALVQHQGSAFIHQLIDAHYQFGIFASASLSFPAFDKTIFAEIKNLTLRTPGNSTIVRDRAITQDFKSFLKTRRPDQPFFSFLFYDAVHNYCESVTPTQHPFKPWMQACDRFSLTKSTNPLPYLNRYYNAVYFVDTQVKQVLDALDDQGLLKNTVVILTADHGEEINDHHSGYWEHASAYTDYQLHVPMLVYWPGQPSRVYRYLTTHYDVVPTLMTRVLDCRNPTSDYTIGYDLFTQRNQSVLIAGSYADYAVVTPDRAVRIYPGGDYVVDDTHGQPLEQAVLQAEPLTHVFEELNKYFEK